MRQIITMICFSVAITSIGYAQACRAAFNPNQMHQKFDSMDHLTLRDLLNANHVEYSDMLDFVVVKPIWNAGKLNDVAIMLKTRYYMNLVLLDNVTFHGPDLEAPDNIVIYQSKLMALLSERLSERQIEQMIMDDLRIQSKVEKRNGYRVL